MARGTLSPQPTATSSGSVRSLTNEMVFFSFSGRAGALGRVDAREGGGGVPLRKQPLVERRKSQVNRGGGEPRTWKAETPRDLSTEHRLVGAEF